MKVQDGLELPELSQMKEGRLGILQSEIYKIPDSSADIKHIINVADYVGEACLRVYYMRTETEIYEIDHLKLNVLE
jgi:hypothetical protein